MAVFTWECDPTNVRESIEFNTLITQFESGREQRRSKGEPRRRWKLQFRKDQDVANEIWDFYLARRGSYEAFEWRNPLDNQTYTVRFAHDNLDRTVMWKMVYQFGIELVEVI